MREGDEEEAASAAAAAAAAAERDPPAKMGASRDWDEEDDEEEETRERGIDPTLLCSICITPLFTGPPTPTVCFERAPLALALILLLLRMNRTKKPLDFVSEYRSDRSERANTT